MTRRGILTNLTWQGEVYFQPDMTRRSILTYLSWQGEVYWPTWHDKAKYIDLPDLTRRSILTYLTWKGEVYWPTWHDKAKYIDLPDLTRRIYWPTWHDKAKYIDLPDMVNQLINLLLGQGMLQEHWELFNHLSNCKWHFVIYLRFNIRNKIYLTWNLSSYLQTR